MDSTFIHSFFISIGTFTIAALRYFWSAFHILWQQGGHVSWRVSLWLGILSMVVLFRIDVVSFIASIPYRVVAWVLRGAGIRSRQNWCVVYDSVTKTPIDPAYVSIQDMQGKEVAAAVTDLDGRFALILPRGVYRATVQKTNYTFPSVKLLGKTNDARYTHLYFGDIITVERDEAPIEISIPLDPVGKDWNQHAKRRRNIFIHAGKVQILEQASFWYGLLGAILLFTRSSYIRDQHTQFLYTYYGWLCTIGIVYVFFHPRHRPQSMVVDKKTGIPYSFAEVRIFNAQGNQVARKKTTLRGSFVALLPRGTYRVEIARRTPKNTYEKIYTSSSFTVLSGYLGKRFEI